MKKSAHLSPKSIKRLLKNAASVKALAATIGLDHSTVRSVVAGNNMKVRTREILDAYMPGLEYIEHIGKREKKAETEYGTGKQCGVSFVRKILPGYLDGGGDIAIREYPDQYPVLCEDNRYRQW